MKYFLIAWTEDNRILVTCFLTKEERELTTVDLIYGDMTDESISSFRSFEGSQLLRDGIVRFEGDPPLQWIDDKTLEIKYTEDLEIIK